MTAVAAFSPQTVEENNVTLIVSIIYFFNPQFLNATVETDPEIGGIVDHKIYYLYGLIFLDISNIKHIPLQKCQKE